MKLAEAVSLEERNNTHARLDQSLDSMRDSLDGELVPCTAATRNRGW